MATDGDNEMTAMPAHETGHADALLGWDWEASHPTATWLEYVGRTALVLTGPFTGRRYRFVRPGARLAVDVRDRHALLAVPVLKPVIG